MVVAEKGDVVQQQLRFKRQLRLVRARCLVGGA